jgi:hypothetical protein
MMIKDLGEQHELHEALLGKQGAPNLFSSPPIIIKELKDKLQVVHLKTLSGVAIAMAKNTIYTKWNALIALSTLCESSRLKVYCSDVERGVEEIQLLLVEITHVLMQQQWCLKSIDADGTKSFPILGRRSFRGQCCTTILLSEKQ